MKKIDVSSYSAVIETDSLAFADGNSKAEIARIQAVIERNISLGQTEGSVLDICGNSVCAWVCKPNSRIVKAALRGLDERASRVASKAIDRLPINIMLLGKVRNAARNGLLVGNAEGDVIAAVRDYAISLGAG